MKKTSNTDLHEIGYVFPNPKQRHISQLRGLNTDWYLLRKLRVFTDENTAFNHAFRIQTNK